MMSKWKPMYEEIIRGKWRYENNVCKKNINQYRNKWAANDNNITHA